MEKFYKIELENPEGENVLENVPNRFKVPPEEVMKIFFSKNRKVKHASWDVAIKWYKENGFTVKPFTGGRTR